MKQQRAKKPVNPAFGLNMLTAFRGSQDKINELVTYITECEDIVNDCQHFLELYDLNASEQIRITGILRETMRNRRAAIDEKQLIIAALIEIRGRDTVKRYGLRWTLEAY